MEIKKWHAELACEKPGYPWQVVEGEGITWIILRQNMKVKGKEIGDIAGVKLKEFSWSMECQLDKKQFYKGCARLSVYYLEKDGTETGAFFAEAGEEEGLFRELLLTCNSKCMEPAQQKDSDGEAFFYPSMILDNVKLSEQKIPAPAEMNVWQVEMPWQAWLCGQDKTEQPSVEKVHVTQTGLSSLLLEVLIKLETVTACKELDFIKENHAVMPKEEVTLTMQDAEVQEIVGVAVKRAFWSSYADPAVPGLALENIKKSTIIFISSRIGGERILTASFSSGEKVRFSGSTLPPLPPVSYQCYKKCLNVTTVDPGKILYQCRYLWTVSFELEKAKEAPGEKPMLTEAAPPVPQPQATVVPPRKKPLEKWLKKAAGKKPGQGHNKTLLNFKMLK